MIPARARCQVTTMHTSAEDAALVNPDEEHHRGLCATYGITVRGVQVWSPAPLPPG